MSVTVSTRHNQHLNTLWSEEDETIRDFIFNFNKIQSVIPKRELEEFYRVMIDYLEYFSVDYNLIDRVIVNCFNVIDDFEVECLLYAHHRYRTEHFSQLTADEQLSIFYFIDQLKSQEPPSQSIDFTEKFKVPILCQILLEHLQSFQRYMINEFDQLAKNPNLHLWEIRRSKGRLENEFKPIKLVFSHVEILHRLFLEEKKIHQKLEHNNIVLESQTIVAFRINYFSFVPQYVAMGEVLAATLYYKLGLYGKNDWAFLSFCLALGHMAIYSALNNFKNTNTLFLIQQSHAELHHLLEKLSPTFGFFIEVYSFVAVIIVLIVSSVEWRKMERYVLFYKKLPAKNYWKNVADAILHINDTIFHTSAIFLLSAHNRNYYVLILTMIRTGIKYSQVLEIFDRTKYKRWFYTMDMHFGRVFYETLYRLHLREEGWTEENIDRRFEEFIKNMEHFEKAVEILMDIWTVDNLPLRYTNIFYTISAAMNKHQFAHRREEYLRFNPQLQLVVSDNCVPHFNTMRDYVQARTTESQFAHNKKWPLKIPRHVVMKLVKQM